MILGCPLKKNKNIANSTFSRAEITLEITYYHKGHELLLTNQRIKKYVHFIYRIFFVFMKFVESIIVFVIPQDLETNVNTAAYSLMLLLNQVFY